MMKLVFKKISLFNEYDIQYFVTITNKLNNRPGKLLGYKNPLQIFMANFKPN
jgi:IS30 family transposase